MDKEQEVIVIGAGIAGISAAAQLACYCKVTLLERESAAGYHATGRSAATFAPAYGNEVVRNLTAASEAFYTTPPHGFTNTKLINQRDAVFLANQSQGDALEKMLSDSAHLTRISTGELLQRLPFLDREKILGGAIDHSGGDLDVDAILQGFLRQFRNEGGLIFFNAEVRKITKVEDSWQVETDNESYSAPVVVNAAGAWADDIAILAGVPEISITPMRRSALLVDPPQNMDMSDWPFVIDVEENFYFKPEAGQLLISPADETPSAPCDAFPDDMDLAIAIDKVQGICHLEVNKINHSWAGLRSFASDRTFVCGFEPSHPGFFWLAGQGGYGVQSAPAMADIACYLISGSNNIISDTQRDLNLADISPSRFR